jgi:hypothetical protein
MTDAERIADMLAYEFLRRGNFSASTGPIEIPGHVQAVGAVADVFTGDSRRDTMDGFAGLAVQSVGFEEGTANPKIHVYSTRGSVKLVRSLPIKIDNIPCVAHRMDPISVRPETVGGVTNRGHIFEKKGARLLRHFLRSDVRELRRNIGCSGEEVGLSSHISTF